MELVEQIKTMQGTIDSQHAEISPLNRNIDKLLKENRELRKRLEKYEKPPNDSGNSSAPLTKEAIMAEVERNHCERSPIVEGQPGHEGTTCKMLDTPQNFTMRPWHPPHPFFYAFRRV